MDIPRDALVLKALTIVLGRVLPVSSRCTHVKGHGGAKATVRQVQNHVRRNQFVFRTDVKSFYASINHFILLDKLAQHIGDPDVLNLLCQYLRRTVEKGGNFFDHEKGISLGCPLSPLMGAFFLHELDCQLDKLPVFYVRFMDDILVLSPTRWKLRQAVKQVNRHLSDLGLDKHPDKTFVGRIAKGFVFLGYHFSFSGLSVADVTIDKFKERAARLYEQECAGRSPRGALGMYVRRWCSWAKSSVKLSMQGVSALEMCSKCDQKIAFLPFTKRREHNPVTTRAAAYKHLKCFSGD